MPLRKLKFLKNHFYHVFNRGNHKSAIFFEDKDYLRFLEKLAKYKNTFEVRVHAYALLPNHFHFLLEPKRDASLVGLLKSLQSSHSHYLSVKHSLQGHLFQGPFKAKLIEDEASFLQVFRYICLQPIKERLLRPDFIRRDTRRIVRRAPDLIAKLRAFRWGSYVEYLNPRETDHSDQGSVLKLLKTPRQLSAFVESPVTADDIIAIEALEVAPRQHQDPGS